MMGTTTEENRPTCVIGDCDSEAFVNVTVRRVDGRIGWRSAESCLRHLFRVAAWASQPFDNGEPLDPIT